MAPETSQEAAEPAWSQGCSQEGHGGGTRQDKLHPPTLPGQAGCVLCVLAAGTPSLREDGPGCSPPTVHRGVRLGPGSAVLDLGPLDGAGQQQRRP